MKSYINKTYILVFIILSIIVSVYLLDLISHSKDISKYIIYSNSEITQIDENNNVKIVYKSTNDNKIVSAKKNNNIKDSIIFLQCNTNNYECDLSKIKTTDMIIETIYKFNNEIGYGIIKGFNNKIIISDESEKFEIYYLAELSLKKYDGLNLTEVYSWQQENFSPGGQYCNTLLELNNKIYFCRAYALDKGTTILNQIYSYNPSTQLIRKVIDGTSDNNTIIDLKSTEDNIYTLIRKNGANYLVKGEEDFKNIIIPSNTGIVDLSLDKNFALLYTSYVSLHTYLGEINLGTGVVNSDVNNKKSFYVEDIAKRLNIPKEEILGFFKI